MADANGGPDFSTAKQDVADIFNIVCARGKKTEITPHVFEYKLGDVFVMEEESFRCISTDQGSVTETKGDGTMAGHLRFVELDPVQLKQIARDLRQMP